jgi:hypothetical protein
VHTKTHFFALLEGSMAVIWDLDVVRLATGSGRV